VAATVLPYAIIMRLIGSQILPHSGMGEVGTMTE